MFNRLNTESSIQTVKLSDIKEDEINGGRPESYFQTFLKFIFSNILCSIRGKALGTILCIFVIFYAVVLGVVLGTYPQTFLQYDKTRMNNLGRGLNRVIKDLGDDLGRLVLIYAAWTNTFNVTNRFLASGGNMSIANQYLNQEYSKVLLQAIKVEMINFYYLNGSLAFGKTFNIETGEVDTLKTPKELLTIPFQGYNTSNLGERAMGFVVSSERGYPYLIMGMPIQDDFLRGPSPGTLIMARRIDSEYITEMSERIQSCVTLYSYNNRSNWEQINELNILSNENIVKKPIIPKYVDLTWQDVDFQTIFYIFSFGNYQTYLKGRRCWPGKSEPLTSVSETYIKENRISGLNLYADVFNNNALMIRADADGKITQLSNYSIITTLIIILILCIVFFIVIALLLEFLILIRLTLMTARVKEITNTEDQNIALSMRIHKTYGFDEISSVEDSTNHLLGEMEESQGHLQKIVDDLGKSEEQNTNIMSMIPDSLVIFDPLTGKIHYTNLKFEKAFYPFKETLNKTIYQLFPDIKKEDLQQSKLDRYENVGLGKFGSKIKNSMTSLSIKSENSDMVLLIIEDLREREEAIARIKQEKLAQERLQKRLEFETDFNDRIARTALKLYCDTIGKSSDLEFLVEIEEYKKMNQTQRLTKQEGMLTFLLDSEKKLSLSEKTYKEVVDKCKLGNAHSDQFKDAEVQLKKLFQDEIYPSFKKEKDVYQEKVIKMSE